MDFEFSDRCKELRERLLAFMDEHVYPAEPVYHEQLVASGDPHSHPPVIEELKDARARARPLESVPPEPTEDVDVPGLSNAEYAPLAEIMGRSHIAPEACNCAAPDTGNMEVLTLFGTPEQKERWLAPLLEGEIRSAFAMTEPAVASSDATNIELRIERDGDEYVLNGRKWWISGAMRERCKILIVMGKTDPDAPTFQQQSMILVPRDTPGVTDRPQPPGVRLHRPGGARRDDLRGRPRPRLEHDQRGGPRLPDRPGPPRARAASTTACGRSARPSGRSS